MASTCLGKRSIEQTNLEGEFFRNCSRGPGCATMTTSSFTRHLSRMMLCRDGHSGHHMSMYHNVMYTIQHVLWLIAAQHNASRCSTTSESPHTAWHTCAMHIQNRPMRAEHELGQSAWCPNALLLAHRSVGNHPTRMESESPCFTVVPWSRKSQAFTPS